MSNNWMVIYLFKLIEKFEIWEMNSTNLKTINKTPTYTKPCMP